MRNRLVYLSSVVFLLAVSVGTQGCERKPRMYAGITPDKGTVEAQRDAAKVDPNAHYNDSKLDGSASTK